MTVRWTVRAATGLPAGSEATVAIRNPLSLRGRLCLPWQSPLGWFPRLSKFHVIARQAPLAVAISCRLVAVSLENPCHCEPVRRLAWQSVLLLHQFCRCNIERRSGLPRLFEPRNDSGFGELFASKTIPFGGYASAVPPEGIFLFAPTDRAKQAAFLSEIMNL